MQSLNFLLLTLSLAAAGCAASFDPATTQFFDPSDGQAPFSRAVRVGNQVYLAGVIGNKGNALVTGGIGAETTQALNNIEAVLSDLGLTLSDVVKCTVYLSDIDDFAAMNTVYAKRFHAPRPARTTVAVLGLVYAARIEIDCIASTSQAR